MPIYIAKAPLQVQRKFPNGQTTLTIYQPGDEVDYDGLPGDNLEPTCDEGRAKREEADALLAQQRAEATMNRNAETAALAAAFKSWAAEIAGGAKGRKLDAA